MADLTLPEKSDSAAGAFYEAGIHPRCSHHPHHVKGTTFFDGGSANSHLPKDLLRLRAVTITH